MIAWVLHKYYGFWLPNQIRNTNQIDIAPKSDVEQSVCTTSASRLQINHLLWESV